MNIHEAAKSGKPFTHSDMIGAWLIVDGLMVHRDNMADFKDMAFIRDYCMPSGGLSASGELYWMHVSDLTRDDWELVDLTA